MLKLRELRKRCGITMKELGNEIGVAESTVSQYETGKRQPDYETLLKLSEYFGVSVDCLLGKENAPAETGKRSISDDDIKFALFGGDGEITDAMYDEVRNFAAYVKQREAQKSHERAEISLPARRKTKY